MEIGGELDTHSQKTTHSALDYAFATDVSETPGFEPRTYEEAIHSKDKERWILAIDSELNSHQLNGTWIVVDNDGTVKNLSGCKWVFKIKLNSDGSRGDPNLPPNGGLDPLEKTQNSDSTRGGLDGWGL